MERWLSDFSGEDDGLLQSGDVKREDGRRSASPTDPVHSLSAFTRKTGAFVNKPSTQVGRSLVLSSVTAARMSPDSSLKVCCAFCYVPAVPCVQTTTANLDLPFSAFASRGLDSEENDPMVIKVLAF